MAILLRNLIIPVAAAVVLLIENVASFSVSPTSDSKTKTNLANPTPKQSLLESLDVLTELNPTTPERSRLVDDLAAVNPTPRPGSTRAG